MESVSAVARFHKTSKLLLLGLQELGRAALRRRINDIYAYDMFRFLQFHDCTTTVSRWRVAGKSIMGMELRPSRGKDGDRQICTSPYSADRVTLCCASSFAK